MILAWLRRRRRRRRLATPFPEAWRPWLEALPFHATLDDRERARLQDLVRILVAEKNWEGCSGLAMTAEIQVVIAAQAALLLLNLDQDDYEDVESILVHPTSFESPYPWRDEGGVVSEGVEHLGEAYYGGPVLLAWDSAQHGTLDPLDGTNLVLHEFAHRLDFADGWIDGTPPLCGRVTNEEWARVMTTAYEQLRADADAERETVMDHYGATDEAEFFAVAVETFFERGPEMRAAHADLYGILARYFRQDPAARTTTHTGTHTGSDPLHGLFPKATGKGSDPRSST